MHRQFHPSSFCFITGLPLYNVDTTLKAVVESTFTTTPREDLRLDDKLVGTSNSMSKDGEQRRLSAHRSSSLPHKPPVLTSLGCSWALEFHTISEL
jgi:hypothetical protein